MLTFPQTYVRNGKQYNTKELVKYVELVGTKNNSITNPITVKWYMGKANTSSRVYCSIWIHNIGSGTGHASGYGYCKQSAAFSSAIESLGIKTDIDTNGTGIERVEDLMMEMGKQLGYDNLFIVRG